MRFDDDFVRLLTGNGNVNVTCKALGVDWPPPKRINVNGIHYELVRHSTITDAQRAQMTAVARGAEYKQCDQQQNVN